MGTAAINLRRQQKNSAISGPTKNNNASAGVGIVEYEFKKYFVAGQK
jgi:hypothetical protein